MYLKTAIEMGHREEDFNPNIDMMKSFRNNFKNLNKHHPNFGKNTIGYNIWWTILVTEVLSEKSKKEVKQSAWEEVAQKLIHKYETDECWMKFNKSDEIIAAMKKEKKILGVISNFDPRLHHLLKNMKLNDFDFVITSYEAQVQKPNEDIFKKALIEAQKYFKPINPSEVLHIGNERDKDFEGAKNAGFNAILIDPEDGDFKNIEEFYDTLNNKEIFIK